MKAVSNATVAAIVRLLENYSALLAKQPGARGAANAEERRKITLTLRRLPRGKNR